MNASPVIQAGIDRPDRKKSVLVCALAFQHEPDAEHEREVDDDEQVVDPGELHLWDGASAPAKYTAFRAAVA